MDRLTKQKTGTQRSRTDMAWGLWVYVVLIFSGSILPRVECAFSPAERYAL